MSWSGVAAWPERALPCHGDAVLPVSTTWRNCYRTYHIVDTCYYLGIFTCRRHRYVYDHFPFRLIVFCFVVWVYCHCKLLVAVGLPVLSSICQHSVSATAPLCIRVLRSTIIIIIIIIITRRHALPADGYSFAARHAVNVWVGLSVRPPKWSDLLPMQTLAELVDSADDALFERILHNPTTFYTHCYPISTPQDTISDIFVTTEFYLQWLEVCRLITF